MITKLEMEWGKEGKNEGLEEGQRPMLGLIG